VLSVLGETKGAWASSIKTSEVNRMLGKDELAVNADTRSIQFRGDN
jgi:hypothetical protein